MGKQMEELPPQAKKATQQLLELLDPLEAQIHDQEKRIQDLVKVTPEMDLLMTIPYIGPSNVKPFVESRFTSKNCQIIEMKLFHLRSPHCISKMAYPNPVLPNPLPL
jgi:hypothetical protein